MYRRLTQSSKEKEKVFLIKMTATAKKETFHQLLVQRNPLDNVSCFYFEVRRLHILAAQKVETRQIKSCKFKGFF